MAYDLEQVCAEFFLVYKYFYEEIDTKNKGIIRTANLIKFLKKSELPEDDVINACNLSDPESNGFVDLNGFCVALKLVSLVRAGHEMSLENIHLKLREPPYLGDYTKHMLHCVQSLVFSNGINDRSFLEQFFESLKPVEGQLAVEKVKRIFLAFTVSTEVVNQVLLFVDQNKNGKLDKDDFIAALKLLHQIVRKEYNLDKNEKNLLGVTNLSPQTNSSDSENDCKWVVPTINLSEYRNIFKDLDGDNDGYLTGDQVAIEFYASKLPKNVLAKIWDLCDIEKSGKLTEEEFALAFWFVERAKEGIQPPHKLSINMVPPSMRNLVKTKISEVPEFGCQASLIFEISNKIDVALKKFNFFQKTLTQKRCELHYTKKEIQALQSSIYTLTNKIHKLRKEGGEIETVLRDLCVKAKKLRTEVESKMEERLENMSIRTCVI